MATDMNIIVEMKIERIPHKRPSEMLEDEIARKAVIVKTIQERPNTAVQIVYGYNGRTFTGNGFSKVCWPDQWNENIGFNLAYTRAIRSVRKQIQQYVKDFSLPLSA